MNKCQFFVPLTSNNNIYSMSFGSMSSANSTLKSNRSLNKKHRKGFKDRNQDLSAISKEALHFKEVSEEELVKIKKKIQKKVKRQFYRDVLITLLLTAIVFYGIYYFIF